MNNRWLIPTLLLTAGINHHALAQSASLRSQWDRESAAAAIDSVDIISAINELADIASLADSQRTVAKLKRLEGREDWPVPAREAAVYRFTRSLAELPPDAVSPGILKHLKNYQARTLVPHEDHAGARVPLFNIRAAAAGVENSWLRQRYAYEAQVLLANSAEALVMGFESAGSQNQRYAFIEVLQNAPLRDVIAAQDATLEKLADSPSLTPLIATTAAITAEPAAIERLLMDGSGAGVSAALTKIGQRLPLADLRELLLFAIQQAPAISASMAIAAWTPQLRHDRVIRDLLVIKLQDSALGASAALALANQPNIQTIKILQDTASGNSIAARRAQMALDLNREQLNGDNQP